MRSSRPGIAVTPVLAMVAALAAGCSDSTAGTSSGGGGAGGDASSGGGMSPSTGGGDGSGGAPTGGGGGDGAGTTTTGATTGATTSSTAATTGGGNDEYAAQRQLCVDTINQLRATEGLPPLERWVDAETCSDESATSDEQTNTPHGAFPACGEGAQNECLGHGPDGIVQCLNQMWDERLQENCAGCDACDSPGACPDCDFFGPPACGHYVNMRAPWHSQVACGFSALGGWAVQNFR